MRSDNNITISRFKLSFDYSQNPLRRLGVKVAGFLLEVLRTGPRIPDSVDDTVELSEQR